MYNCKQLQSTIKAITPSEQITTSATSKTLTAQNKLFLVSLGFKVL